MKCLPRPLGLYRALLVNCCTLCLPFTAVSAGQLPEACKPPAELASAIRVTPSPGIYSAAGAWFTEQGDVRCSLAAFEEAVRLEPDSAEAHYRLGVARVRAQQVPSAADEFRIALKLSPGMAPAHNSLGAVLAGLGNREEAVREFERALNLEPNSVFALDHLAQALAAEGHHKAAIQNWRQALALEPGSSGIALSLGVALYQDGNSKESIRLLGKLVKDQPRLKAAHFTLGNIFAQESQFREAAAEYAQVIRLDPADDEALLAMVKALTTVAAYQDALGPAQNYIRRKPADPEGHLLLGSVYRGLGEYDKAELELDRAVAGNPENSHAQYELGFVLARNNKLEQALAHLEKAVALKPSDSAAMFQLAAVERRLGDEKRAAQAAEEFRKSKRMEFTAGQLASLRRRADELLESGKPEKAAEVYRQMLDLDPRNARTEYNLALALDAAHDPAGARAALDEACRLDPAMAQARAEIGRLDLAAGRLESAEKRLREALEIDPHLVAARGNLAMIYALRGDHTGARKLFQEALLDDPNYIQGHLNLGLILAQEQDLAGAEIELGKAMILAPADPKILSGLSKVEAGLGKSAESIELLRKVVKLSPQSAAAHLDLALALADAYDLPGALTEAGVAVELASRSAAVNFHRGRILFDLGRDSDARPALETACLLAPQMSEPPYLLAVLEKQAGNYGRAIGLLQTVVGLEPRNVTAWNSLGQSLDKEGRTTEAMAAWKQALALDPDNSQALSNLVRTVRPSDPAEADRLSTRYAALQQKRGIAGGAAILGSDAAASIQAHEWRSAIRQLTEAIGMCGDCAARADLHKNLGLVRCRTGDIDDGEKELLLAKGLKPPDPDIDRALKLIGQLRTQRAESDRAQVR